MVKMIKKGEKWYNNGRGVTFIEFSRSLQPFRGRGASFDEKISQIFEAFQAFNIEIEDSLFDFMTLSPFFPLSIPFFEMIKTQFRI